MAGDLHCHTRLSDGSMGIDDLIVLAKKKGMTTISITDHDCQAGSVRGKIIGERHGVQVIPGVELSSTDPATGKKVHVLCYLSDSPDRLEGLCRRNLLARKKASQFMMLKLAQRYPVTPELVLKCAQGSTCVYKQHLMHALMEIGATEQIYGETYEALFSADNEDNILVEAKYSPTKEVIDAIHESGGIAVLAHPGQYNDMDLVNDLVEYGLDGLEVYHPSNSRELQKQLSAIAKAHNILVTGGSDFHGMYTQNKVSLGDVSVNDSQVNALLTYKGRMRRKAQADKQKDA